MQRKFVAVALHTARPQILSNKSLFLTLASNMRRRENPICLVAESFDSVTRCMKECLLVFSTYYLLLFADFVKV